MCETDAETGRDTRHAPSRCRSGQLRELPRRPGDQAQRPPTPSASSTALPIATSASSTLAARLRRQLQPSCCREIHPPRVNDYRPGCAASQGQVCRPQSLKPLGRPHKDAAPQHRLIHRERTGPHPLADPQHLAMWRLMNHPPDQVRKDRQRRRPLPGRASLRAAAGARAAVARDSVASAIDRRHHAHPLVQPRGVQPSRRQHLIDLRPAGHQHAIATRFVAAASSLIGIAPRTPGTLTQPAEVFQRGFGGALRDRLSKLKPCAHSESVRSFRILSRLCLDFKRIRDRAVK